LATDMLASQSRLYRCRFWPSFQQNVEPIEWVNGLRPRAGQRWPNFPKHTLIVTSPPENPHRKRKTFFSMSLEDLLDPQRVWTAL